MKKRKENGSVIFRVCLGSDNDLHEAAGLGEGESRGRVEGEGIKHNIHWENTVEPPNKGHFGANSFVSCREVVPISDNTQHGAATSVLCREVVPISEVK